MVSSPELNPIHPAEPHAHNPPAANRLDPRDVVSLLRLMAELSSLRNDPRTWRLELLSTLTRLLPAAVAAAFMLKTTSGQKTPQVTSIFDVGFKTTQQREAFLDESNAVPFQDPFSAQILQKVASHPPMPFATVTAARRDLVDDDTWYGSTAVENFRRMAGIDDCIFSAHRRQPEDTAHAAADETRTMVIATFRRWDDPNRFTARETLILNTLHNGLSWLYRAEEATHRVTRATALSPRLRETLDYLLAGDTERQVALKMSISVHTVHDYVKALYIHFGVSSRGELLARWIQSGGQLPVQTKDD